jgi:hypothetical protein
MNIGKLNGLMVNGEGFAFDPRSGHTYTLNDTGLFALNCLKAGASLEQVCEQMAAQFAVDRHTAERDLEVFLNVLQRNQLVELEVAI